MKRKYVAVEKFYPDCPSCQGSYGGTIKFFSSVKEILYYVLNNLNEYEIEDVYSVERGKKVFEICVQTGQHRVLGAKVNIKGLELHIIDDGHGNKVWRKRD